jgi:3-hydroxy acid dehydrogenase/malonic semialdehyde reductase
MNRIKGKLIVITGASSGIGRACAEQCASCGANLVLTARRIERLQELKSRLEQEHPVSVDIHKLDVRERADVRSFADNLKKSSRFPDVLINNAGLASGFALIQEGDFEDWDRMIDTNIKGLLNVSRTLIPLMVEKGSGHVVNVGSIAGYQVYPRGNVYNATTTTPPRARSGPRPRG